MQHFASQQAPDGAIYAARKNRKNLRSKTERIKLQKTALFRKISTQKNFKIEQDESQLSVGFFGRVAWIVRV
ncbi:phage virion morphogenesis protein [Collimonas silvisoli]|uniref:phage virion morphogenesis protein n=1 Tax=Collimonas silvisoli TaxID=2825884 RepID=UPI001B8D9F4B|nr:phage virion morphogenesis protein [Collimonas silvisoli]